MKQAIVTIVYFVMLILIWHLVCAFNIVSPAILPKPAEVMRDFPSIFSKKEFLPDLLSTISRSSFAFLLSLPIGIISGYLVFYSKLLQNPNELFLDFLRSIPATALIPVFLIIFGIGDTTKIAVGTFSSSLMICLSTILGLKSRNFTRLYISKVAGLSPLKRFLHIDIPESLGQIFVGLRAGVSLSLVLVVVSEMFIGSNHGLGKVINDMRYSDALPKLYCALITTGLIGYLYNYILVVIEKKIIHWKGYV